MSNFIPLPRRVLAEITKRALQNALDQVEEATADEQEIRCGVNEYEKALFAALVCEVTIGTHEVTSVMTMKADEPVPNEWFGMPDLPLIVRPQFRLLDWPVSFLVSASSGSIEHKGKRLVVECDTIEEKEKSQAQIAIEAHRDQQVSNAGYDILRFSASDLIWSPCECADKVIDWAIKNYCA